MKTTIQQFAIHRLILIAILFLIVASPSHAQRKSVMNDNLTFVNVYAPLESASSKSGMLAAVYSLLVPGLGEWYVGDLSSGQYHLMSEGSLWLVYGGMRTYSSWIRNDAHAYATQHAGASFAGKDADYDANIGDYVNTEDYNQEMLRNRDYDKVYSSQAFFWQWQNAEQQASYRAQRIQADKMKNNAQFAIAGMVINRVISVFGAVRAAARYNREHDAASRIDLNVTPNPVNGDGLQLTMSTTF
jgi:hypothetical protein